MSTQSLKTPLAFTPISKSKIWGGQSLRTKFGRDLPQNELIGETWEVAGFGNDVTVISNGDYAGKTILDLISTNRSDILGRASAFDFFPLLYKFLDANDKLSIQVHPDDNQAYTNGWGMLGKTECWYVIDAEPSAQLITGVNNNITRDHIVHGISTNTLPQYLNYVDVSPGDMLFIPAGTVHAILGGILIYEIQESSDTTFRLYDWNRVDDNGVARQLHIDQSLAVIDYTYHSQHKIRPVQVSDFFHGTHSYRVACRYFVIEELQCQSEGEYLLPDRSAFYVVTNMGETADVTAEDGTVRLKKGDSCLIPAVCKEASIWFSEGSNLLISYIPDLLEDVITPLRKQGVSDKEISMLGGSPHKNDLIPYLSM